MSEEALSKAKEEDWTQLLEDNFTKVHKSKNLFYCECELLRQAKHLDIPMDSYRQLYETYCQQKKIERYIRKRGVLIPITKRRLLPRLLLSTGTSFWRWTGFSEKKNMGLPAINHRDIYTYDFIFRRSIF